MTERFHVYVTQDKNKKEQEKEKIKNIVISKILYNSQRTKKLSGAYKTETKVSDKKGIIPLHKLNPRRPRWRPRWSLQHSQAKGTANSPEIDRPSTRRRPAR